LLVNDKPESILIIGLGGGSIPMTLAEIFPDSFIDIVEIDEAVVRVAKKYFNFAETNRMKVFVSDARVHIKRAGLKKKQYDFIVLDAFTGDYIPEHLMTTEFLQETKNLLSNDGVLVANTFSTSALYDHESVTYHQVFGEFLNLKMPNTGNRVILASIDALPGLFELRSKSKRFSAMMDNYGVNIEQYPARMSRKIDWDESKRALTDQYNPANLLQGDSY
jgi:spermidine synthase